MVKDEYQYEWMRLVALLALCIISCTISNIFSFTIPRFNNTFTAMWLIYSGYMLRNYFQWRFTNIYVCCISGMLLYHNVTILGGVNLNSNDFRDVASLTITSISALYVVCFFSQKMEKNILGRFLEQCGKDSFYIMGLHFVGFKICTLILNLLLGTNKSLTELKAPANDSIILLFTYLSFGVLFPLVFMVIFRNIKSFLRMRFVEKK